MDATKNESDLWTRKILAALWSLRSANEVADVYVRPRKKASQDVDRETLHHEPE